MRRTGFTIRFAVAVSCALVGAGVACGSFSGSQDTPQGDGSVEGGVTGDGAADGAFADAPGSADAGCSVLYVDGVRGADGNDGCSIGTRMQTIGAALARAKSVGAKEVHVCAGAYAEKSLTIDSPIALLGSFECLAFTRAADAGAPGVFKPSTALTAPALASAALLVTGAGVGATTIVDGFAINGSDAPTSSAIYVTAGAAPTLSNLVVSGGAGVGTTGPGSIGVSIDQGAAPKFESVMISGGKGQNNGGSGEIGSVGVDAVDCGAFSISGSGIEGGSGISGGPGSIGIFIRATKQPAVGTIAITSSVLIGGNGVSTIDAIGSTAIDIIADPRVVISRSQIIAGAGTCNGACNVYGVIANQTPAVEVSRSTIVAGNAGTPLTNTAGLGIVAQGPPAASGAGLLAHDNMILAAGAKSSIAVNLVSLPSATIVDNTMVAGIISGGSTFGVTVTDGTNVVIRNNIFGGLTYGTEVVQSPAGGSCVNGLHIDNNGFVDDAYLLSTSGCAVIGDGARVTLTDVSTALGSAATNNVRISPSCGESNCYSPQGCADDNACYAKVMADPAPDSNILFSKGFMLAASPPCVIAKGGQTVPGVPLDFYGQMRAMPFSIGAQQTSMCAAP